MTTYRAETIEILKKASTAAITGLLLKRHGFRMRAINGVRPIDLANCRFAGPAFTLRYVPQREDLSVSGDIGNPNNAMLKATQQIAVGSVLVMDMMGNGSVGGLGDVLTTSFLARGVAGIVSDGGMRDVSEIAALGMPIYCKGPAAPPSPSALMPIDIQQPIACGGVLVLPGDFIVADNDGVAVIPAHVADDVAEQVVDKELMESWIRSRVAEGEGVYGLYPPNEANLERYRQWKSSRS
ncbi:ribonuclease activity regulator RraA [Microvirga yunnanensis]|uniref:ribonuclease activity regulator RraA n=1 Tax=Microvirga yunnanensis TaxID=2953740 RepID=UPI0021C6F7C2|nr:ribonuclease activity regulator RraA [Microvirga sp. HBU65207]